MLQPASSGNNWPALNEMKIQDLEGKVYHVVAYIDGVCTVEFTKKDILGLVAESSMTMKIVATL